jgi:hypothetical protein
MMNHDCGALQGYAHVGEDGGPTESLYDVGINSLLGGMSSAVQLLRWLYLFTATSQNTETNLEQSHLNIYYLVRLGLVTNSSQ